MNCGTKGRSKFYNWLVSLGLLCSALDTRHRLPYFFDGFRFFFPVFLLTVFAQNVTPPSPLLHPHRFRRSLSSRHVTPSPCRCASTHTFKGSLPNLIFDHIGFTQIQPSVTNTFAVCMSSLFLWTPLLLGAGAILPEQQNQRAPHLPIPASHIFMSYTAFA